MLGLVVLLLGGGIADVRFGYFVIGRNVVSYYVQLVLCRGMVDDREILVLDYLLSLNGRLEVMGFVGVICVVGEVYFQLV